MDHGNALYCIADIPRIIDIRVLAIERISIELLEDTSLRLQTTIVPVVSWLVIRYYHRRIDARSRALQSKSAPMRTRMGQEQHVEVADGAIVLFTAAGRMEIKRWVLSFGSSARVLEPESLAKEIAEEAHRLSALYGSGNTDDIVT